MVFVNSFNPFSNLSNGSSSTGPPLEELTPNEQEKAILKSAFNKSPKEGWLVLQKYLTGVKLNTYENFTRSPKQRRITKNVIGAVKEILGEPRFLQKFPEKNLSFDEFFNMASQARDLIADPKQETIPDTYLVRVLAGATIAKIDTKELIPHAALKKPGNLENRLNRWQEIDPTFLERRFMLRRTCFKRDIGNDCSNFTLEQLVTAYNQRSTELPIIHPTTVSGYKMAVAGLQGARPTQEDSHQTGVLDVNGVKIPFFAVCDGHSGNLASMFVSEHLQETLEEIFKDENLNALSDANLENMLAGLGVRLTNRFIKQPEVQDLLPSFCPGTTLALALILPKEGKQEVWAVNVGDSRILLVNEERTIQLTEDANPSSPRFKKSCEKAGIEIKDGRLAGNLAVASAIGDFEINPKSKAKATKIELDPKKKTRLVIHCDGLNEVFSSKDIGDITNNPNLTTPQEKALAMVEAAYVGYSGDNLSALVIDIPVEIEDSNQKTEGLFS